MTDQTGAEQQSASGSRTGDVDVADPDRPDSTTDVQTGGASDVGSGGPDAATAEDDAAMRGGQDVDAPGREREDVSDQDRDDSDHRRDDAPDERRETSRDKARDSDESARDTQEERQATDEERQATDEERQKTAEEFAREHDPEQHDVAAGEEFRQEGDWTADEAGGPQVWDNEGNLVEGSTPGQPDSASGRPIRSPARRTIGRTTRPATSRVPRHWTRSATAATASARPPRSTTGPFRSGTR